MRMNNTCYKQYDTRWASLPYPRRPWLIRNCGCGEVSICNAIIEMATQAGQTPKTIQPYMVQYAESRGNGTYHYGIPAAMKHYGLTEVSEHATMQKLWDQLRKGGRVAVLLMGSRLAGSKKVKWTGSGHFVAVTAYKEEGGKHWVYVKDSASTSSYRNGWITYEDNIRGACLKCWSGKLNGASANTPAPSVTPTASGKLTIDGVGGHSTVKAMQRFFGTPQDGIIGGQNQSCAKWYPALKSVKYGKGGSPCIRNLQRWVGVTIDGVWGKNTSKALQKKLGVTADGIFGKGSMKAWQKYLNANDKAVYPTPAPSKSNGAKLGEKANALAYSAAPSEAKYPGGHATSAFKAALDKAYPKRSSWSKAARLGASCDVFVGTCVRASGIDPNFPRGLSEQQPYLERSSRFTCVRDLRSRDLKASELQDGDIITYSKTKGGGHICIWYNGRLKHAAVNKWYGRTTTEGSRFKISGKKWIKVYRAK